jgi:hypothetical protein
MTAFIGAAAPLSPGKMAAVAEALGCELATLLAVWDVEAAGEFFTGQNNALPVRFEPHKMPRETWHLMEFEPNEAEPWRASLRLSDTERKAMFSTAYLHNHEMALRATSMGAPQIMGLNHRAAGFPSAAAMLQAFMDSADAQVDAFVSIVLDFKLKSALAARDWRTFASRYNGRGKVDDYATKLESAYRRHSGQKTPVTLRLGSQGDAVRRLQRALSTRETGVFDAETEANVKALQKGNGLVVDGVVGAKTWAVLESAGVKPAPAQPDETDAMLDRTIKAGTAAGPVIVAAGTFLQGLPEIATYMIVGTGCLVLLGVAATYLIRRTRTQR